MQNPMPSFSGFRGTLRSLHVKLFLLVFSVTSQVFAAGEPAMDFIKQLRAAQYFDTALTYLDRISEYPGVSKDFFVFSSKFFIAMYGDSFETGESF